MKVLTPIPYRMIVEWSAENEAYLAYLPAIPGCMAHGATEAEAIHEAQQAARAMLKVLEGDGDTVPPSDVHVKYSGQFRLRLPQSLHGTLAVLASVEGVSLNQYVVATLAEKAGQAPPKPRKTPQLHRRARAS